jgi:hypothetical protein
LARLARQKSAKSANSGHQTHCHRSIVLTVFEMRLAPVAPDPPATAASALEQLVYQDRDRVAAITGCFIFGLGC